MLDTSSLKLKIDIIYLYQNEPVTCIPLFSVTNGLLKYATVDDTAIYIIQYTLLITTVASLKTVYLKAVYLKAVIYKT